MVHLGGRCAVQRAVGACAHRWCEKAGSRCVSSRSCLTLPSQTPAVYYLPGVGATLALLMINCVRRDELSGSGGGYGDDTLSQKRAFLFVSYLASFGAVGGAVASLLVYFDKPGHDQYTGVACVVQCVLIVAAALCYWATRAVDGLYY